MVTLLSLGIAACLGYCLISWINEKKQPPPPPLPVETMPAVIQPLPMPELKLTRAEQVIEDIKDDIRIVAATVKLEDDLKKQHADLWKRPVNGNDTVGSVISRRLWNVRAHTITRREI